MFRETLESYQSQNLFGTVRYNRRLKKRGALTAAYLFEYDELQDLNLTDAQERLAFQQDNTYVISSLFLEMSRKTTDSDTNPKQGNILVGSLELAPSLLGSELSYFKPSIELITYVQLPFQTILAGRMKVQTISDLESNEKIPVLKRLFLGGANSVRGYAFQELGPMDADGNPEGGQTTGLANIELRRPLFGIISGVLFLDVGMVEEKGYHWSGRDLRYSTGGGIRFDTPVGPLRLDIGYKLNPPDKPGSTATENTGKMGRWRFHFNIGHAF
jgi:outer membrane protein insertion porin family/translocation and assembly module TamA